MDSSIHLLYNTQCQILLYDVYDVIDGLILILLIGGILLLREVFYVPYEPIYEFNLLTNLI